MTTREIRQFAIRQGAIGGVIAAVALCLLFVGLPALFTGAANIGLFGGEPLEWSAWPLVVMLVAFLPVVAVVGALGGAALGLACHLAIARLGSPILATFLGVIVGAMAGFVAQMIAVVGFTFVLDGTLILDGFWLCAPIVCPLTALAGLMVSREVIREHP